MPFDSQISQIYCFG